MKQSRLRWPEMGLRPPRRKQAHEAEAERRQGSVSVWGLFGSVCEALRQLLPADRPHPPAFLSCSRNSPQGHPHERWPPSSPCRGQGIVRVCRHSRRRVVAMTRVLHSRAPPQLPRHADVQHSSRAHAQESCWARRHSMWRRRAAHGAWETRRTEVGVTGHWKIKARWRPCLVLKVFVVGEVEWGAWRVRAAQRWAVQVTSRRWLHWDPAHLP
jgi:hypothetical protein